MVSGSYVKVCFVSKKINEKMKKRHKENEVKTVLYKNVLSSVFIHCKEADTLNEFVNNNADSAN